MSGVHGCIFGTVVKSQDGLGALGDSDADGHKYLIDFGNDPAQAIGISLP